MVVYEEEMCVWFASENIFMCVCVSSLFREFIHCVLIFYVSLLLLLTFCAAFGCSESSPSTGILVGCDRTSPLAKPTAYALRPQTS